MKDSMHTTLSIEDLVTLSQQRSALINSASQAEQTIEIHEADGLRWVYTGGQCIQSLFRIDQPEAIVLPNHLAMLVALLCCDPVDNVLNLGFGIGCFERFFQANFPATEIVSVDNDQSMVDLAKQLFQFPAESTVTIQAAEDFIKVNQQTFDIVLCDLFVGDQSAPCLFNEDFYADLARAVSDRGVLALNLSPGSEDEVIAILFFIRQHLQSAMLISISDHGNIVVLAAKQPFLAEELLMSKADVLFETASIDLRNILPKIKRLPSKA